MKDLSWMNNDNDFLDGIIAVVEMLVHQFGYNNKVAIKNIHGMYLYASNSYIKSILLPNAKNSIIGKTDRELQIFPGTDFVETNEQEDKEVIKENHLISFMKIYPYPSGTRPVVFNKAALVNKKTGNTIGMMIRAIEIDIKNLPSKILDIHQIKVGSRSLDNNLANYNLTPREQQIVFLFMANFSSPDIAKIISQVDGKNISKSYVDKVFSEQLYTKFNVNDRKALFDKLRALKFEDHLPPLFLKYCSVKISKISAQM